MSELEQMRQRLANLGAWHCGLGLAEIIKLREAIAHQEVALRPENPTTTQKETS